MHPIDDRRLTHLRFPGIVTVDVSGTNITTAVSGFDEAGDPKVSTEEVNIRPTPIYNDEVRSRHGEIDAYFEQVLVPAIAEQLEFIFRGKTYPRLPIGISFSGQVSRTGEIYSASSIFRGVKPPRSHPLRLAQMLRQRPAFARREFFILNNVSAAAWGLSLDGKITSDCSGHEINQFLVVHVGSGFGSKAFNVRQQQVLLDEKGFAGELGHVHVHPPSAMPTAVPCDCGKTNHLAGYFLPEGLALLCQHLAGPQCVSALNSATTGSAARYIGNLFEDQDRGAGQRILETLSSVLASCLAQVIAAIGIERVVLKGGLFHRLGQTASAYFVQRLRADLQERLEDYFPVIQDFVVLRACPPCSPTDLDSEWHDRRLSLEGLVAYAAALYRSAHRVTSGYFAGRPCFTLSCSNDIRYPVVRSAGVFEPANQLLRDLTARNGAPRKVLAIVDQHYNHVIKLGELSHRIGRYFQEQGRKLQVGSSASFESVDVIIEELNPVKESELGILQEDKTPEQVNQVVAWCQMHKLPRDGMLVAVGGGVTLDIVGFVAQQFRRMVPYLRIPTTLIGQIDAGVGVKVGVNYGRSKNLIGAFYPPYATINDPEFLYDLDERQMECGVAEIIKMGIVADASIVTELESLAETWLSAKGARMSGQILRDHRKARAQFIEIADLAIESMMVELQKNITERELKRLVDFGHTFSPKIESLSDYRIPHGYAVAMDIYLSCHIAHEIMNQTPPPNSMNGSLFERYRRLLESYHLLIAPYLGHEPILKSQRRRLFEEATDDSIHHRGGNLNLVVPNGALGLAGFVNLSFCSPSDDSAYCAVLSRKQLQTHFESAVDALYDLGTRQDF